MKRSNKAPKAQQQLVKGIIRLLIFLVMLIGGWLAQESLHPELPSSSGPLELYSNQARDDLSILYRSAIDRAERSVLLIIYSLSDAKVIEALRKKAEAGIDVRVICDAKACQNIRERLGSRVAVTRRAGEGLMHQKILIVDEEEIWLGSANMTSESLKMHGNLVMALHNLSLANWIDEKSTTLKEEGSSVGSFSHRTFPLENQILELSFLPDDQEGISRLLQLIQQAKKSLRVAMFTWTRRDLAQAIIQADKRGVNVEVVIDHHSGKGASSKIVELLKSKGIRIGLSSGPSLLHHKFLYIDGEILVNGSANWTKAAFTQNDDCFMILSPLTLRQVEKLETVWKTISLEAEWLNGHDARAAA